MDVQNIEETIRENYKQLDVETIRDILYSRVKITEDDGTFIDSLSLSSAYLLDTNVYLTFEIEEKREKIMESLYSNKKFVDDIHPTHLYIFTITWCAGYFNRVLDKYENKIKNHDLPELDGFYHHYRMLESDGEVYRVGYGLEFSVNEGFELKREEIEQLISLPKYKGKLMSTLADEENCLH